MDLPTRGFASLARSSRVCTSSFVARWIGRMRFASSSVTYYFSIFHNRAHHIHDIELQWKFHFAHDLRLFPTNSVRSTYILTVCPFANRNEPSISIPREIYILTICTARYAGRRARRDFLMSAVLASEHTDCIQQSDST
jgi:hypothetical protein